MAPTEGDDATQSPGDPSTEDDEREDVEPSEAFEVLGNETRLAIIEALSNPGMTRPGTDGMGFAELREAVGVRDAGTFSYHLEKLRGHFLTKRDGTYRLRYPGSKIAGALKAGTYTEHADPMRGETGDDCPTQDCDRAVVAVYEDEFFQLRCPDHGLLFGTNLPPGVADDATLAELLTVATLSGQHDIEQLHHGACPHCWGPVEATVPSEDTERLAELAGADIDDAVLATFDCKRCSLTAMLPPAVCILRHPAVVAFLHDHGVDPRGKSYLDFPFVGTHSATVESEHPLRIGVDVDWDSDTLSVTLDDSLSVVDYERQ
jgi:DNA-binding transcriptional ArsR family regulator